MDLSFPAKPDPEPDPAPKVDRDAVIKAAKEYACAFPTHIKKLVPRPDIDTVKASSATAGMEILHACYLLVTEDAKDPEEAHKWFVDALKDFFERITESYAKIGIHARFEVQARKFEKNFEEDDFGGPDWGRSRRWS